MNGVDFPSAGESPMLEERPRMMELREAARAVGGRVEGPSVAFFGVATDSRVIAAGDLFVALKGARFDGHEYVAESIARGAVAALTSRRVEATAPISQVVAADTRIALGRLAAHWRARYALPLVALTGSNGKTTVKEMLTAILAAHCGLRDLVLATEGNLNNDIGMPLTLLGLREHHRYAVIEMGMNHEGEIDYLTRLAQPAVALVNNAHTAHLGILGSVEAIARAKGEIYAGLNQSGIAVINADDDFAPYWKEINQSPHTGDSPGFSRLSFRENSGTVPNEGRGEGARRIVTFGFSDKADVRATSLGAQLRIVTPSDAFAVTLQVAGEHNVRNALAACAAAHALGIPVVAMQQGLRAFSGVPGRLQRRRGAGDSWVIDDSYNANPESMKAAIEVLAAQGGRRVLVMGDMGELGGQSDSLHAQVGVFARSSGIEALFALGPASRKAVETFGAGARHFEDAGALIAAAGREAGQGATLLVKGSRFMQMERVADALAAKGEGHAARAG